MDGTVAAVVSCPASGVNRDFVTVRQIPLAREGDVAVTYVERKG
jgi:hypothetical protein